MIIRCKPKQPGRGKSWFNNGEAVLIAEHLNRLFTVGISPTEIADTAMFTAQNIQVANYFGLINWLKLNVKF